MGAVLMLSIAASPGFAATKQKAQMCATDGDLAALNVRVLQTEMMVAALSCGERQRYNTFVTDYQTVLTQRGRALQTMFVKTHGNKAEPRLNAFITKLANDASKDVRLRGDTYCEFAAELFDEVLAGGPANLNKVASKPWIESRHGFHPCIVEARSRKQTG
ncbi:MAG: hypothetical protein IPK66_11800 [Rhodospirillales bacterium]|nr:hypothetical protein [Rhodospirillales bacterium]